jgi:hypothetical protein
MSAVLVALSTPVYAQGRGWTGGLVATIGDGWQFQGLDFGLWRPASLSPVRGYTVALRVGSFFDQGAIVGGTKGFVGGVAFTLRTGSTSLAEVGSQGSISTLAADFGIETAAHLASDSQIPEGDAWFSIALLPGLRFGRDGGMQGAIVFGPALFVGTTSHVYPFVGLRIEVPLAPR